MRLSDYIPEGAKIIKNGEYRAMGLIGLASEQSLFVYISEKKYLSELEKNVNVSCVICTDEIFEHLPQNNYGVMISQKPRVDFFETHNYFSKNSAYIRKRYKTEIHPSSKIHKLASIAENNVKMGENCLIEEFASIKENVIIGNNTIIRSGVVIGNDGFQFNKYGDRIFSVKHLGGVLIGDNVEIQPNSVIAKAIFPWDNTVIEDYTKIDDLSHISHACKIGKRCLITAGTVLAGSTVIGNDVFIGLNSTIIRTMVGNSAFVGIGSVVIDEVLENKKVFGYPARTFS
jgi:UDP-3-O-[3-hydroxymyristoyl] glucosamine N-acyltransferase